MNDSRILHSLPSQDHFHMPAEYEPHRGTMLAWPVRPGSWTNGGREAGKVFLQVAFALAQEEEVWILADKDHALQVRELVKRHGLKGTVTGDKDHAPQVWELVVQAAANDVESGAGRIHVLEIPTDDAWARDIGPTFVVNSESGETRGIDWQFNAWGGSVDGLYAEWDQDNRAASAFCHALGYDYYDAQDFVLEGGSIHSDGEGTLLVTESCLLSAGRNPGLSKEQIERRLLDMLGAEKTLWLPRGIWQDETNEHVDNVCAFTKPGEVALAWTDDPEDPQYALSHADLEYLSDQTDARGRRIVVHKLPIPDVPVTITQEDLDGLSFAPGEDTREAGERLAASYVNFYIGNGVVLVPAFGGENKKSDDRAARILADLFPDRRVLQIPARAVIVGGGNLHCITQQVPKAFMS